MRLCPSIQLGHWSTPNKARSRREAYLHIGPPIQYYIWRDNCYWEAQVHANLPNQVEIKTPSPWTPTATSIPVDIKTRHSPRRAEVVTPPYTQLDMDTSQEIPETIKSFIDKEVHEWEKQLLENVQWIMEPFEIMQHIRQIMKSDDQLLIVSDGSSIENVTMSFGVVIGSTNGTIFVEAMGPANGRPSSHRAECTGCLAGALLLKYLMGFTRIKVPQNVTVKAVSDNQGMIQRLINRATYSNPYPNSMLEPDWDLIEEIHATYWNMSVGKLEYDWVRGHQDSDGTDKLSPEAIFNIRADQLAGEYSIMVDRQCRPKTPLMTQTKCVFYIAQYALHSHYTTTIRRATEEPAFFQYLKSQHSWSSATVEDVNWDIFRQAARNYSQHSDIHLLKLVHDKLPTNYIKSRYQSWTSSRCHYCQHPETFDHLCVSECNPHSKDFRTNLRTNVHSYLQDTATPPQFTKSLMKAMDFWLYPQSDHVQRQEWPGPIGLYNAQSQIGWRQMFQGFLSKAWQQYLSITLYEEHHHQWLKQQESDHSTTDPQDKYFVTFAGESDQPTKSPVSDPQRHLARLTRLIWTELSTLWSKHLESIHQGDSHRQSEKYKELTNQIRTLHNQRSKVLAAHRDQYFFTDIETYLQNSTVSNMQRYVNRYQPVIMHSIRQARLVSTGTHRILQFPGFSKHPNSTRLVHASQEETPHRKHTKQRNGISKFITNFFPPKNKPSSDETPPP